MSILDKNLEAMRYGFPELYDRVKGFLGKNKPFAGFSADHSGDPVVAIESLSTLTEIDALVIQTAEGRTARLNSAYNPKQEAVFWADGQRRLDASNLFILGLGNGVFAEEILRRRGQETKVVIYEPSLRVFLYVLEHFDIRFCFREPGVRLIVEALNEDLFAAVTETMITNDNYMDYMFLFCPQMQSLFPDSRKQLLEMYARDGIGWIQTNRNIERRQIRISPYNQIHNLQYLEENTVVPYLKKVFPKDVPVILIGAGPSLKDEIEVLRNAGDKAFLFAADSALSFLLKENIVPDAFVCIEAKKPMSFFQEEEICDIPAFVKVDSTHRLLRRHRAAKIFGYDIGYPQTVYEEYGVPQSQYRYGSNGMTSLFSICDEMGVETVIFVGQDMCFGPDGRSHAGGRDEGFEKNERFLCENNQGETVQSRLDWFKLVKWYENAMLDCSMKHVINTSAHGAKIKGCELMTLEQALERFGTSHEAFKSVAERADRTFSHTRPFDIKALYENSREELVRLTAEIEKNPRSPERKRYRVYQLVEKYEIADPADNFEESQKLGLEKLSEYFNICLEEVGEHE